MTVIRGRRSRIVRIFSAVPDFPKFSVSDLAPADRVFKVTKHKTRSRKIGLPFVNFLNGCEGCLYVGRILSVFTSKMVVERLESTIRSFIVLSRAQKGDEIGKNA